MRPLLIVSGSLHRLRFLLRIGITCLISRLLYSMEVLLQRDLHFPQPIENNGCNLLIFVLYDPFIRTSDTILSSLKLFIIVHRLESEHVSDLLYFISIFVSSFFLLSFFLLSLRLKSSNFVEFVQRLLCKTSEADGAIFSRPLRLKASIVVYRV